MERSVVQSNSANLADVIERILDKGLIINADITVSIVGVELLGIKIRAAVASFETAAKYGLEFPTGTRLPKSIQEQPLTVGHNGYHKVAALSEV